MVVSNISKECNHNNSQQNLSSPNSTELAQLILSLADKKSIPF